MEDKSKRVNKRGQLSFSTLIVAALLLSVFIVATISFGNQLSVDNNSTDSIINDPEINQSLNDFTAKIEKANTDMNASRKEFFSDIPVFSAIVATVTVIFGVIPTFFDLMLGSYNLVGDMIQTKLGVPKIILNLLTAIIMFLGIILSWRVYKAGS